MQDARLPLGLEPTGPAAPGVSEGTEAPDQNRAIVHLDLDAFYASVEMLENPNLRGKPVLIGGRPESRGVVATASYPARAFGVRSAMPMARALRLCPHAIVLPPRFKLYRDYSHQVMDIVRDQTALVEKVSIDEAYLDLTEQLTDWCEVIAIAQGLQESVRNQTGLSASLGVATCKLVAKVASDHDKPGGLTVVVPGNEGKFLAPLPVRVIWGVGPVTARRLRRMGVTTAGDLTELSDEELQARFGEHGIAMARRARGIDRRPVRVERERKSVSRETTFSQDLRAWEDLKRELWRLSKSVARRLEQAKTTAGTIAIKVRYEDFETLTRQMALDVPTADETRIYWAALVLLRKTWERGRAVRLLGVGGDHLSPPTGQLPLL